MVNGLIDLGGCDTDGDKSWYLTRDYYMWLNFLPIFDKEEKKYGFAIGILYLILIIAGIYIRIHINSIQIN